MSHQHDDAILTMATYFVDNCILKIGRSSHSIDPALRYELIQWKANQIADLLDSFLNDLEQYSA